MSRDLAGPAERDAEAAVHPRSSKSASPRSAENLLKCRFALPKSALRPPESGPLVQSERRSRVPRPGHNANHVAQQENTPCVTLIFPRSIVRPSASTVSSRCSTRSAQPDSAPDLSALQHRAHRRECLPHLHGGRRLLARTTSSIEAHRNVLTVKGERKDESQWRRLRSALSRHRRARLRAPLPACRPCRGAGRRR